MAVTESVVKRWGNSLAVVIPKESAKEIHLREGDEVSLSLVKKDSLDGFGALRGARPFVRDENLLHR